MCGLYATYGTSPSTGAKLKARGPDMTEEKALSSGVVLGFHRLAIRDTSRHGMQPFSLTDGIQTISWICNGEIYNYDTLKKEYSDKLSSTSDCELIGHLYLTYGREGMISMLDGEFALILVSEIELKDSIIYATRDRYGVRPLYVGMDKTSFSFSSELKGLSDKYSHRKQLTPGVCMRFCLLSKKDKQTATYVYEEYPLLGRRKKSEILPAQQSTKEIQSAIVAKFEQAVQKRLVADRPLACLLSGGLDSSLVCAVAQKFTDYPLHTYTIGLKGGTDLENASIVADHIGSIHHEIIMTNEEALNVISDVIYAIESWDTTTIRASTFQYLIGHYINNHSDHKVILTGEGSDELAGGYLYFHDAPSSQQFDDECRRLLRDIHLTDGLRVDRAMAAHGLEVRIPFLDHEFTEYYLSLPCSLRDHSEKCEKYLLRSSFASTGYLPDEILRRKKEAFSDGVSTLQNSWYQILQKSIENEISDTELDGFLQLSDPLSPKTKEQIYFRKVFIGHFGESAIQSIK